MRSLDRLHTYMRRAALCLLAVAMTGCGDDLPTANATAAIPDQPALPALVAERLSRAQSKALRGEFQDAMAQIAQAESEAPGHPQVAAGRTAVLESHRAFAARHANPDGDTRVVTIANPDHSYELYIPPAYDPEVPHPILYVFDAEAQGKNLLMHCLPGAQSQGWIIAASNNSKNGPWREIFEAQDVMLADTEARLTLDPARRFATGFSGGARTALALAFRYPDKIAGVLAMGAGWPVNTDLQATSPRLKVAILIGEQDSNIQSDIPQTIKKLQNAGIVTATDTYPAAHEWPRKTLITGCFRWLAEQTNGG